MVIDLQEKKLSKEGMVSVKALIKMLENDSDTIKSIVVSTINDKDEVYIYSAMDDSVFKLLGLLEASKKILLQDF